MTWQPGHTISRCEVLHRRLWLDHPVAVVADDGEVFAVLLEPGSPFRPAPADLLLIQRPLATGE